MWTKIIPKILYFSLSNNWFVNGIQIEEHGELSRLFKARITTIGTIKASTESWARYIHSAIERMGSLNLDITIRCMLLRNAYYKVELPVVKFKIRVFVISLSILTFAEWPVGILAYPRRNRLRIFLVRRNRLVIIKGLGFSS